MNKLRKIAEIRGSKDKFTREVLETLENKGFLVVDDDEYENGYKTWHILKEDK